MRPSPRSRYALVFPFALAAALAPPAAAQFAATEVSELGAPPFLLTKAGGGVFEDLGGGTLYNVYRRVPGDDFRCLDPDLATPVWAGDPASPAAAAWWYVVNAWDGAEENRHGSLVPIVQPCHQAPVAASKSASPATVGAGGTSEFTLVVDNSAGTAPLLGCTIADDVDATGCMALVACTGATPPLPSLVCDAGTGQVTSGSFDVPAGATQTVTFTVRAGNAPGRCDNSFTVVCGPRSGGASGALDVQSAACTPVPGRPPLRLVRVVGGLNAPVHLTAAPGDASRLFVVEQAGRIRIVRGGAIVPTDFLDLRAIVLSGGERGLLSMAFHPQYAANGRFFVYYTTRASTNPPLSAGDIVVAEFRVSATDPDQADPASGRVFLTCDHHTLICGTNPCSNHNGGQLAFGPDGYLYIGMGDGGGGGDPGENAEDLGECLGKLHRIDVDVPAPPLLYSIPPTNPFVATPGARPEIWAYGLRNPWRFSFDRLTGDLYIADVGQNRWEEVDVQPAASPGGEHYGWDTMEGSACFEPMAGCSTAGRVLPVAEYSHANGGCSVTGGFVYRGCRLPGYHGTYFYADYCTAETWSFEWDGSAATNPLDWTAAFTQVNTPTSFGEDADGELYIVNGSGAIHRISD